MHSFSQAGQDLFAAHCLNYKKDGFYYELGANEPFLGSNTAFLEIEFNFSGISIEFVDYLCQLFNQKRKNPCFNFDLNHKSLTEILDEQNAPRIIDFMSHDLDGHDSRLNSLKTFDFNKYKVAVLCWEHDFYDGGEQTKIEGEKFLEDNGMVLVCKSVKWQGKAFESWAVDPTLVPENLWKPLVCENLEYTEILGRIGNE